MSYITDSNFGLSFGSSCTTDTMHGFFSTQRVHEGHQHRLRRSKEFHPYDDLRIIQGYHYEGGLPTLIFEFNLMFFATFVIYLASEFTTLTWLELLLNLSLGLIAFSFEMNL